MRNLLFILICLFLVSGCKFKSKVGCQNHEGCSPGWMCKEGKCIRGDRPEKPAEKVTAKKEEKKPEEPKFDGNHGGLAVKVCPGFWNLPQNIGTLTAKETKSGQAFKMDLKEKTSIRGARQTFEFINLPLGKYEVFLEIGEVVPDEKSDMRKVACGKDYKCKDKTTLLVEITAYKKEKKTPEDKEIKCHFNTDK